MAIGFTNKLQFFHILKDKLRTFKENSQIKYCSCLKFSNGGAYLAAAHRKPKASMNNPPYTISIIDSYSTEIIRDCKGHIGRVVDIAFTNIDLYMWSAGNDGKYIFWELDKEFEGHESEMKGNECYTSLAPFLGTEYIFLSGV